jgi:hypothetical protein
MTFPINEYMVEGNRIESNLELQDKNQSFQCGWINFYKQLNIRNCILTNAITHCRENVSRDSLPNIGNSITLDIKGASESEHQDVERTLEVLSNCIFSENKGHRCFTICLRTGIAWAFSVGNRRLTVWTTSSNNHVIDGCETQCNWSFFP